MAKAWAIWFVGVMPIVAVLSLTAWVVGTICFWIFGGAR